MKFTDGYWHMRPDVTAHFPAHVSGGLLNAQQIQGHKVFPCYKKSPRSLHFGGFFFLNGAQD